MSGQGGAHPQNRRLKRKMQISAHEIRKRGADPAESEFVLPQEPRAAASRPIRRDERAAADDSAAQQTSPLVNNQNHRALPQVYHQRRRAAIAAFALPEPQ